LECSWLRCDELELAVVDYLVFWEMYGFHEQMKVADKARWWPSKQIRMAQAQKFDLLARMSWAYSALRYSGTFSPNQIREALLHAQSAGAAWKPEVFAILDRAITRDPPVWIVGK